MNIKKAIEIAIKDCKDPYARVYLQHIGRARQEYGEQGFVIQLRYFLSNASHWTGGSARNVKKTINKYIKNSEY